MNNSNPRPRSVAEREVDSSERLALFYCFPKPKDLIGMVRLFFIIISIDIINNVNNSLIIMLMILTVVYLDALFMLGPVLVDSLASTFRGRVILH